MMITSYRIEPKPTVIFTETEVFCFLLYSEQHYDALCRSVSKPGRESFLWGMKNRLAPANEDQRGQAKSGQKVCEVEMTITELNLLAKICECDPGLCTRVTALFDEAQKRYRVANGIPERAAPFPSTRLAKSKKQCRTSKGAK